MVFLYPSQRSLSAYRHSFLVNEDAWITSRIPLYYLDLEVPNETLFAKHFQKVFPDNQVETGVLGEFNVTKGHRFHLDDTSVGCRNSNSFHSSAAVTQGNVDIIGKELFLDFSRKLQPRARLLRTGESAVRFLNLATLVGYQQWMRENVILHGPHHLHFGQGRRLVDQMFAYIYPSILKGVYMKKSEHPLLVKVLWDIFCLTPTTRRMLFKNVPDAEHLKFMLQVANRIKFDFWGRRFGGNFLTERIFLDYVRQKRFELITVMLEYGFTINTTHYPDPRLLILTAIHNVAMVRFLVSCCYESWDYKIIKLQEFIEVFQKLFRMHPLPSLPSSIVRKVLQIFHCSPTQAVEMAAFYEDCNSSVVAPSDRNVVTPQKLSHLSRCVLRKRLAANYQLPTAIDDSRLPTPIKQFLSGAIFEWDDEK